MEPSYTPPPEQPLPPQNYYQAPEPQPQLQRANPGKTLAIIGFIFAFLPLQIIGLILSIIGLVQSHKVGMKNGLAVAGIILNSIFLFIGSLLFLVIITALAYAGPANRADTQTAKISATNVVKYAEIYASDYNGLYPETYGALTSNVDVTALLPTTVTSPITSKPDNLKAVEFYSCGAENGNKVGYWDSVESEVVYVYSGTANSTSTCTLAQS